MCIVFKLIGRQRKSQSGVVIIAALLTVLILTAVGFFALTVSGDDIKIAAMVMSEERALSTAESAAHIACTTYMSANNFNGQSALPNLPETFIDPTGVDTTVSYKIENFIKTGSISAIGSNIAGGSPWQTGTYTAVITGRYAVKNNTIMIQAGIMDAVPK